MSPTLAVEAPPIVPRQTLQVVDVGLGVVTPAPSGVVVDPEEETGVLVEEVTPEGPPAPVWRPSHIPFRPEGRTPEECVCRPMNPSGKSFVPSPVG